MTKNNLDETVEQCIEDSSFQIQDNETPNIKYCSIGHLYKCPYQIIRTNYVYSKNESKHYCLKARTQQLEDTDVS